MREPCAWLDSELGESGAVVVTLSRESVVALANAGRTPADIHVRDGQLAFRSSAEQPGRHELQALKVVVAGFSLGDIRVADHGLLVQGPLLLENSEQGLDLSGASVTACANFDGELQRAKHAEVGFSDVEIDDAEQSLSVFLTYEADFEFDEPPPIADLFVGGSRVRLTGSLSAAGKQPWIER